MAFFREYKNVGLTPQAMPVVSVSIAEEEVGGIGVENITGQLTAWNYYQTIDTPVNKAFVKAYKAKYGANKPTSDPMEAAYVSVYLWKNTVEKAKSFDVKAIQENAGGRHVRRARGPGHDRRREPPHHQDRTHRRDPPRRPDLHDLGVPGPDRAGPVPQVVPVGRRSLRLIQVWMS